MLARRMIAFLACSSLCPVAFSQVFLSKVFNNPPGSYDTTHEFIELAGAPGMKLDGYAVALIYGLQEKLYNPAIIPPMPSNVPEIDEFMSLDGLSLGKNGLLVLAIGPAINYPLTPDTNYADWNLLWNGPLDVPGKLENDGSITVMLVRNRPGATQSNPSLFPVWVKDRDHDIEITLGVLDPSDGQLKTQLGNGKFDLGGTNSLGVPQTDMLGVTTPTLLDDLEIVDEVSYEHDRGWEYDVDQRVADVGSTKPGMEERNVHTLDDPQGINPDFLMRVDSRRTGPGWTPIAGATGAMSNGKNWQDTATEQWVRAESILFGTGVGVYPYFYFDATANIDVNAPQPYNTHVPTWLADGQGVEWDFTPTTVQILAGQVNPYVIPFIPGDNDRDGDTDNADIERLRSRFLDASSLFINSYPTAPEGSSNDPATQVRPFDLDSSGDNGIDPNDLQWALNFQGDTTGRIQGVTYDASGPSTTGVVLADGSNVIATLDMQPSIPCGAAQNALRINDVIEITIRGALTSGAVTTGGAENGISQFAFDIFISNPGVLEVVSTEAVAPFALTRASLLQPSGSGQLGINRVVGYTTSFTEGLSGPVALAKIRLRAIGAGSNVAVSLSRSFDPTLSITEFQGLKIAHTDLNGEPGFVLYPNSQIVGVTSAVGSLIAEYGAGCPGTGGFVPRLAGEGCATPGGTLSLEISKGLPGALPNLFIGLGNGQANLVPNCKLQNLPILPSPVVLIPLFGTAPGTGTLPLPGLPIPGTVPLGISIYLQSLWADPQGFGGIASTNPLKITFGL